MNANEQTSYPFMDMLAEYFRKKNEPVQAEQPVGVGPVASGDMYGEMLRQRDPRAIPLDVGQPMQTELQDTPIEETVGERAVRIFKNGPTNEDIKLASQMAGIGLPKMRSPGVTGNPIEDLGIQEPIKQEKSPEQKEAPTVEQVETVKEIAKEKIVSDPDTTPQEKQDKMNQLDSNPSIAQKLAMIAMAVAPTMVGYAMAGKKGAFLGAAATGKGLETGAKAYQDEQQEQAKMDLAKEKLSISGGTKAVQQRAGKPGGETEDELGFVYKYDEQGVPQPVMLPSGKQLRRANPEIVSMTPSGELSSRKKYEEGKQAVQRPEVSVPELKTIGGRIQNLQKTSPKGFNVVVPESLSAYQHLDPDDPNTPLPIRERYYRFEKAENARLAKYIEDQAKETRKPVSAAKPSIQDRAAMDMYKDEIKKWAGNEWKQFRDKQSNAEIFFNRPTSEIKSKGVADAALWFDYMKEIQQDQSVVREGDVATAMRFMSTKQRIDSLLSQYGMNLGSAMTDNLRKEIIDYLSEIRKIKEKQAMMDINGMVVKGMKTPLNIRAEQTLMPSTARDAAKSWASSRMTGAPTLGMAAGTPIWKKRIPEMVAAGELKNGQFVKDTDGDPYLIHMYRKPNGKFGVQAIYWAVK